MLGSSYVAPMPATVPCVQVLPYPKHCPKPAVLHFILLLITSRPTAPSLSVEPPRALPRCVFIENPPTPELAQPHPRHPGGQYRENTEGGATAGWSEPTKKQEAQKANANVTGPNWVNG
jgi:hypothetical protein